MKQPDIKAALGEHAKRLQKIVAKQKRGAKLSKEELALIGAAPEAVIYDTMAQASGALGIPVAAIKRAKEAGCPAFRKGSRVCGPELIQWLAANPQAANSGDSLKDERLREQIRKLRMANDREESRLVLRSLVVESLKKTGSEMRAIAEQVLTNEYPSAVAGLDVPQVRVYGKRCADRLDELWEKLKRHWEI